MTRQGAVVVGRMARIGWYQLDLIVQFVSGMPIREKCLGRQCYLALLMPTRRYYLAVDIDIDWQLPFNGLFLFGTFDRIVLWSSCERSILVMGQSIRCA